MFVAAMSSTGNRVLGDFMPAGKANPFHDEPRGTTTRLELVGTIPHQTQSIMNWSPDGRHLATSTGENVYIWRLPRKCEVNKPENIAQLIMPENDAIAKAWASDAENGVSQPKWTGISDTIGSIERFYCLH